MCDSRNLKSLRGCLQQYANPELMAKEQEAWQDAAVEKHAQSCDAAFLLSLGGMFDSDNTTTSEQAHEVVSETIVKKYAR